MPTLRIALIYLLTLLNTTLTFAAPIAHEAYIWRRQWSTELTQSICEHANLLSGYTVLAAEITPSSRGDQVTQIKFDAVALKQAQVPVTLAIRVGNYPGPFTPDASTTQTLLHAVGETLKHARQQGLQPAAIEIDFDCATRKLRGYQAWLEQLRPVLDGVPLSITTLPTWMSSPDDFAALVQAADHYVLQAHSIQRPTLPHKAFKLCDAKQTLQWAQQASEIGHPFHLALPTYGYQLSFDSTGKLVRVDAENEPLQTDFNLTVEELSADPVEMAQLINSLQATRPEHCQGVIWYRLPSPDERLNWDAATWRAVMQGDVALPEWQIQAVPQPNGLVEIQLTHTSPIANQPPAGICVQWKQADALAWDGQRNFTVTQPTNKALTWSRPVDCPTLAQGERWTLGWIRFDTETPLQLSIIQ
ncbi:DUF3142 domain-containing protein [Cerasicoccus maritimus]|uniref:DUF3142 domain-containing protein n=1 Tax=Cerasicoccus maritimus TaxID=490089 RepID=UPI00285294C5|nr:DUF3142 domain-containing protein [Cerasicoccus maritimus]